jgi:uncharacterized damage-inducible protein DinB
MSQILFQELIEQNKQSCSFVFNELNAKNVSWRLNENASSAGFMYRHIGETMLLFGYFFGIETGAINTTMGSADLGQGKDLEESNELIEKGYNMLTQIVTNTSSDGWLEIIETPFFGKISKARLFSHVLYHNSYHAGQIGLTLKRAGQ